MLQPTADFSAKQIRFLQNEATEWIQYVNGKIIEAANNGQSEVHIDITSRDPIGTKYWKGGDALIEHFKSRGFGYKPNGQSSIIITWAES